jgi:hypothetical protein
MPSERAQGKLSVCFVHLCFTQRKTAANSDALQRSTAANSTNLSPSTPIRTCLALQFPFPCIRGLSPVDHRAVAQCDVPGDAPSAAARHKDDHDLSEVSPSPISNVFENRCWLRAGCFALGCFEIRPRICTRSTGWRPSTRLAYYQIVFAPLRIHCQINCLA